MSNTSIYTYRSILLFYGVFILNWDVGASLRICIFIFSYISFVSEYYRDYIYPWTVPILLPVAQISLTASVYTTVVMCFDRYIAICRPTLLGNKCILLYPAK